MSLFAEKPIKVVARCLWPLLDGTFNTLANDVVRVAERGQSASNGQQNAAKHEAIINPLTFSGCTHIRIWMRTGYGNSYHRDLVYVIMCRRAQQSYVSNSIFVEARTVLECLRINGCGCNMNSTETCHYYFTSFCTVLLFNFKHISISNSYLK